MAEASSPVQDLFGHAPKAAADGLGFEPGVNLSGLEFNAGTIPGRPNTDYAVPNQEELAYYHSKGINLIRLPVLWERLQPGLLSGSAALDQDYLGLIRTLLGQANALGMSMFVDVHDYGGYGGHKLGDGTVGARQFAAFWQTLARALANTPGLIGYDLMNEPSNMPNGAAWPAAVQAAVYAVRSVDTGAVVAVEGDGWSSAGDWTQVNGLLNVFDPANRLVYEAHVYGDRDNSGTHFRWADEAAQGVTVNTIADRVSVFSSWCRDNGHVCFVGEVGVGNDDPNWNVELANGLARMRADGLAAATYWSGGPWWGDYPMSIEPRGGDRPQMSVLSAFGN